MINIARINLLITLLSKGIAFVLAIYVAKVLDTSSFAYYLYFLLITSYLPLLHMGSLQGLIFSFPKIKINTPEDATQFYSNTTLFSVFFQMLVGLPLFFFDFGVGPVAMVLLFLNLPLDKFLENELIRHSTYLEFTRFNILKGCREIGIPVLRLFLAFMFKDLALILMAPLFINLILLVVIFLFFKNKIWFINDQFRTHIKHIYKIGFPIFVFAALETIIRSVDRMFVAHFFSKEIFANYGFATNMAQVVWLLSSSYLSPYSQLMFDGVAKKDWHAVDKLISETEQKLTWFLAGMFLLLAIFYPLVTEYVIKKYQQSYIPFMILLAGNIFLSMTLLKAQYLITISKGSILIRVCLGLILFMGIIYLTLSVLKLEAIYFALVVAVSFLIYLVTIWNQAQRDLKEKLA